ncbi:MAG: hypothetical protein V3V56_03165 [bacterium]
MLQVDDVALHLIHLLYGANNLGDDQVLRLVMKEGGEITFEPVPMGSAVAEDMTFEHEGRKVLLVGKDVAEHFSTMKMVGQVSEEGEASFGFVDIEAAEQSEAGEIPEAGRNGAPA